MSKEISFNYLLDFDLEEETKFADWVYRVVVSEGFNCGEINYIFCDDAYLLEINQQYLNHDTYTDIITFDYADGNTLASDIFISVERVKENAASFKVTFNDELLRVMAHGLLHLVGFKDKTEAEATKMRLKESEKIKMFHVEH